MTEEFRLVQDLSELKVGDLCYYFRESSVKRWFIIAEIDEERRLWGRFSDYREQARQVREYHIYFTPNKVYRLNKQRGLTAFLNKHA